ncbi:MAG: DUF4136 domain-containing protein [Candidatus Krumholzibacteria bacterium]|nr:DUF4136 domain-containing protein [Candidatus Krumholzibacteria bacterium]
MNNLLPRSPQWRRLVLIGLSAALALSLAACYPGGPEELDDIGLVVTFNSPDVNYAGLMTYSMEDTVAVLDVDDSSAEPLDTQFNPTILQALQDKMAARGFTREMNPENNKPDVWLAVGAVKSTTWFSWTSWGYWGGYYPPSYGGGYYPSGGVANFEQGSIVWQALDLRDIADPTDPATPPPVMWRAGINGALSSSNSATHGKITEGITQGFSQSPYMIAAPPTKQNSQGVR